MPKAIAARSAIPPIVPPTMAPTGVEDFELVLFGVLDCELPELPPEVMVTVEDGGEDAEADEDVDVVGDGTDSMKF